MIGIAISGLAAGYGIGSTLPTTSPRTTATTTLTTGSSNASAPYVLTLVITTENQFNSTVGDQPTFYVLGPDGLQSTAQINLPANRLIKLIIVNYDEGSANLTDPKYATATGVVNNRITLVNNTLVNSTMGSSGILIRGVENVSSLPESEIGHTFTIPSLGINVPVATLSTEVAYFTLSTPGKYSWFCMTACGSGSDGLGGAMSTPGWMSGSVVVQ
jgi:hypothetical protein